MITKSKEMLKSIFILVIANVLGNALYNFIAKKIDTLAELKNIIDEYDEYEEDDFIEGE